MEKVLLLTAALACPLGMLAMGGVAWVSAKAFGRRPDRPSGEAHGAEISAKWNVTSRWTLAPSYDLERIHIHRIRTGILRRRTVFREMPVPSIELQQFAFLGRDYPQVSFGVSRHPS